MRDRYLCRRLLGLALVSIAMASCGGGDSSTADNSTTDETNQPTTGGEDALPTAENWEGMAEADKQAFMAQEVLPRMQALFTEFDGERYADFSCATCHGPGAANGDFEMPSNSLPALHATGTPEQHQMVREYGDMVRFMFQRVLPTMQTMLGAPDYDEQTQEGFSCYACHPHAGDEGSTPVQLSAPSEEEGTDAGG